VLFFLTVTNIFIFYFIFWKKVRYSYENRAVTGTSSASASLQSVDIAGLAVPASMLLMALKLTFNNSESVFLLFFSCVVFWIERVYTN